MIRRATLLLLSLVFLSLATAQAQKVFDVASVKPSPRGGGDTIDINLGAVTHGVVTLTNVTLSECIRFAYGLVSEEQIAGPDWIRDRDLRVDIVAKAQSETSGDELLAMTRSLLAERFRLTMHREPKRIAHLEMSVAKKGPKLVASEGEGPSVRRLYGRGRLAYTRLSMDRLAMLLSRQLRQPVINSTSLRGAFDVDLQWAADDTDASAPDIFSAMQQQLGLKLEAAKAPLEVLVVDHAERVPVAN